jgi:hypothetical protein
MRAIGAVRLWVLVSAVGLVGTRVSPAEARSLAGQLSNFISIKSQGVLGQAFPNLRLPDTITPAITALAAQGTDFPVPPTTPGYVFAYNPETKTFERSTGSLGPVFLERVETVGRNHVALGVSYLYGNVDSFDGSSVAQGFQSRIGLTAKLGPAFGSLAGTTFEEGVTIDKFELPTSRINLAATYGVTDDLDVGLLLPLVVTQLDVAGRSYLGPGHPTTEADVIKVGGFQPSTGFDDSSFGVGDLLVRAKYRFGYFADVGFAGGLTLRCPTGNLENFHGLGAWTVQPALIVSRAFGLNDVHANLGIEFNAADSEQTRARYGIGATLQVEQLRWVAFLVDILGTSGLDSQHFSQTAHVPSQLEDAAFVVPFSTSTSSRTNPDGSITVDTTLPRTDQVNLAVGFKFAIYGNALGYLNALVPLTRQGLQADIIPVGGIEYSF